MRLADILEEPLQEIEWTDLEIVSNINVKPFILLPPMVVSKRAYIFTVVEKDNHSSIEEMKLIYIVKLSNRLLKRYNNKEYIEVFLQKKLQNHTVEILNHKLIVQFKLKEIPSWDEAKQHEQILTAKIKPLLAKL